MLVVLGLSSVAPEEQFVLSRNKHSPLIGAPAGIRTPNQQIMRRFEGHQQGETKQDNPVFTESAAVKVRYISLRLSTPSRHNRAIREVAAAPFRPVALLSMAGSLATHFLY